MNLPNNAEGRGVASNDRRLVTTDDSHSSFPRPWRFVASVPSIASLPPEGPIEVAFVGRSNVGKSSLINALVGQNALARTSNTPGRTQTLNFFVPDDGAEHPNLAIVDMPGYGYAKAPKKAVEAWTGLIRAYLKGRAPLRRVFVLVDSRHGLKPADTAIMDALDKAAVSYQIVLTKADKITPGALDARIAETAGAVVRRAAAHPEVLATSSTRGLGLDSLQLTILDLAAAR